MKERIFPLTFSLFPSRLYKPHPSLCFKPSEPPPTIERLRSTKDLRVSLSPCRLLEVSSFLEHLLRRRSSTDSSTNFFLQIENFFDSLTMARSLSNARVFVSLISENLSIALNRRGYAAAASEGVAGMGRGSGRMGKAAQEEMAQAAENSWIPDPVTGYYRPANRANEIDVADLREMLLKQKIRSQ